ncbi:hypothetical protein DER46DRAFT_613860 [Fusarium sp. MPI-SDFR-AT-0072]|nr:hypothetical protein DER46DRAFT_613860 [Fusarium sp. MPI-SDFR-AT-0072]
MCKKATCNTCKKATWWGCGNHVPKIMSEIPEHDWCTCEPKVEKEGKKYPPKAEQLDHTA